MMSVRRAVRLVFAGCKVHAFSFIQTSCRSMHAGLARMQVIDAFRQRSPALLSSPLLLPQCTLQVLCSTLHTTLRIRHAPEWKRAVLRFLACFASTMNAGRRWCRQVDRGSAISKTRLLHEQRMYTASLIKTVLMVRGKPPCIPLLCDTLASGVLYSHNIAAALQGVARNRCIKPHSDVQ